jgi:hypothetical protein
MTITQTNATVECARQGVLPFRNYVEWQLICVTDEDTIDAAYSLN